ncbi:MAG TPA: universal stress protein [Steroidobacteraceae bacterium]
MKILAAVDFSPVTEEVLATLTRMAATLPTQVWLVHVAPPEPAFVGYDAGPDVVRGQVAAELRTQHQQLQQLADRLRLLGVDTTALQLQGPTVNTVMAEADRLQVALIVLGSHGHGAVYNMLVGSVAEGVVRASKVPVLLVPPKR